MAVASRSLIVLSMVVFALVAAVESHGSENAPEEQLVVTIAPKEETLQNVFKSISEQTNWTIIFDEALAATVISGDFVEVPFDTFLKRALKGANVIVTYDYQNSTLEVRSFGAKDQQQLMVDAGEVSPFPTDKEEQQILANQIRENKLYEEYQNNPDSIEPLTGMTLGEIAALQAREQKIFDEYQNNPNSIEPITGITLGDIETLADYEELAYEEYSDNPLSVEPLTGMTLGEIAALRQARQEAQ